MKKQLYIFNPWHDMALANFTPYYKIPSEILRMTNDLAFLPLWYAPDDTLIKIPDTESAECFCSQVSVLNKDFHERFTADIISGEISPWGWSPALVHMLANGGVESGFLPDVKLLDQIRYLSGRQRCVDVLTHFSSVDGTCGETFCCHDMDEVKIHLSSYDKIILKAPWSGSGRGLCRVSSENWTSNVEGWASRILRTQGCIMAEPLYNKVCDFAMEFYSSPDGEVTFAGYSLFETDDFGNYKQNILMSDSRIEYRLLEYGIRPETLYEVRNKLLEIFNQMIGGIYTDYFGVDMMLCNHNGRTLLHPCVEINMRMNMGVVSRMIFDIYVSSASAGLFVVEHYNSDNEAIDFHKRMTDEYPLDMDDGNRIRSGYLTLTPVLPTTRYQAYIIVSV